MRVLPSGQPVSGLRAASRCRNPKAAPIPTARQQHAANHSQRVRSSSKIPAASRHEDVQSERARHHGEEEVVVHVSPSDTSYSSTGSLAAEIRDMPGDQVADTLWAYVLSRGYDPALFATVAAVASEDLSRYPAAAVASILSAQAHARHADRAFVLAAAQHLAAHALQPAVYSPPSPAAIQRLLKQDQQAGNEPELDSDAANSSSSNAAQGGADADSLAQALWAVALLVQAGVVAWQEEAALQEAVLGMARGAARKVTDLSPDELPRVLAALAALQLTPPPGLLDSAAARLRNTLLPTGQLSAEAVVKVVWAYAQFGSYERSLFDAAQDQLQRHAAGGALPVPALAQAAWAYSAVRELDVKHRRVYDANMFQGVAMSAQQQLAAANSSGTSSNGSAAGAAAPAAATTDAAAAGEQQEPIPVSSVLTLLLALVSVSHSNKALFTSAAKYLAPRLHLCNPQELVVLAHCYTRMKHSAPQLVEAVAAAVQDTQVLSSYRDADDLVYLAMLGPATNNHNQQLMTAVVQQALELSAAHPGQVPASSLLELARCVAAVAHHAPQDYAPLSSALLRAANASHLAADMEDMSTHCGATNELGLQK